MQYLILIITCLIVLYLISAYVFARLITRSHRQKIGHTPAEYGMPYEDVTFLSEDGLKIKGWFIPGKSNKTVIITHPFPFNRHGFLRKNQGWLYLFRTDVDFLTTAQALNKAGYHVLMFDFRNHGESSAGMTGIGLNEALDVAGAVAYVNERFKSQDHRTGFVSFCMGANAALIAVSKMQPSAERIACLVAVQPISALVFIRSYLKSTFSKVSWILIPVVDRFVRWMGGYALEQMTPQEACQAITIPTMFIQGKYDSWTELSDIQSFYDAVKGEKQLLWIEEKIPRFEVYNRIGNDPETVLTFLEKHL